MERKQSHRCPRSSRQRYREFVQDYNNRRLDEIAEPESRVSEPKPRKGKRREYLREYLHWLWPHRFNVGVVFVCALLVAGLQMIEPLFMRFIIDRVLLNTTLNQATRLTRLNLAGAIFLLSIVLSNMVGVVKDYRQRILNTQVMLAPRRSLFDRLLHLIPPDWRRGHHHRALANGHRLPRSLDHSPGNRRWRATVAELAFSVDGDDHNSKRHANELRIRAADSA